MSVKVTQITREVVASTNVFRVRVQMPGIQGPPGPQGLDGVTANVPADLIDPPDLILIFDNALI